MAVSVNSAARYICEQSGWEVTNLKLQKILYLASMVHMGRNKGVQLIDGGFEAWDYGPVQTKLYRKIKAFGSKPIPNVFFGVEDIKGTKEEETLREACRTLLSKSPAELVNNTHWEGGAWAKNYIAGVRGITIPNEDIVAEYEARVGHSNP